MMSKVPYLGRVREALGRIPYLGRVREALGRIPYLGRVREALEGIPYTGWGREALGKIWHKTWTGWAFVGLYAGFVVVLAILSTGFRGLYGGSVRIPPVVYVFCTFGVLLWGLRSISRQTSATTLEEREEMSSETDDSGSKDVGATGEEIRRFILQPFAALPVAAAVYLVSKTGPLILTPSGNFTQAPTPTPNGTGTATPPPTPTEMANATDGLVTGPGGDPGVVPFVVLALFAGLFLPRTYDRLGRIADELRPSDGTDAFVKMQDDGDDSDRKPLPWWPPFAYFLSGLVAVPVAAGWVPSQVETPFAFTIPVPLLGSIPSLVPVEIYLYAFLGVMGRIFTELIRENDVSLETLVYRTALIPMVMLLGGGIYLVLHFRFGPWAEPPLPAVAAVFLVGLYEGVGFDYLAFIGNRLFPTLPERSTGSKGSEGGEGSESDGGEGSESDDGEGSEGGGGEGNESDDGEAGKSESGNGSESDGGNGSESDGGESDGTSGDNSDGTSSGGGNDEN